MNVSWGILHRIVKGIFDRSKNMAAFTKIKQGSDNSLLHISPKPLGLAKLKKKMFSMIRSICGQIFIIIYSPMLELLPFFDIFLLF